MKKIWSWVILAILVLIGIVFFMNNPEPFKVLLTIKFEYILLLLFLVFVSTVVTGLQIKYITKAYGKNLNFKEWYSLSVVNTMANYFAPFRGGSSVRAVYLKKVHGLPYTVGVTTIGAVMVITIFLYSLLGAFISLVYNLGLITTGIFFAVFVCAGFIIFMLPFIPSTKYRKINYIIKSINEIKNLRKNYAYLLLILIINFALLLLAAFRIYYAFQALSYNLSFTHSFVIALFSSLALVLNVTPAALGIKESIITLSAKVFGVTGQIGLSAALIDRAVAMVYMFSLGPILSFFLSRQKKR